MAHPVWFALQQHIAKHLGIYAENLLALFFATISTSPESIPRNLNDLWTWGREALITATPARFSRPAVSTHTQITSATATTPARIEQQQTETVPTTPVAPAQPPSQKE